MSTHMSLAKNVNENQSDVRAISAATAMSVPPSTAVKHEQIRHDQIEIEADVISQLRANLMQLEELNSRLGFMMNEVAGLVRKK